MCYRQLVAHMLTISVGFDHARQMAFYHLKGSITMHNTARKAIKICHLYCPTQIGKREKTRFILEKKRGEFCYVGTLQIFSFCANKSC